MRRSSLTIGAIFITLGFRVVAQDASAGLPVVSLETVLSEAAASGADLQLVDQNLGVARLQRSLDLAKQGVAVSAGAGYTVLDAVGQDAIYGTAQYSNNATLIAKAEAASLGSSNLTSNTGLAQSPQGSLNLTTPLTKVSLSAAQTIPPPNATLNVQSTVVGLTATQTVWDGYPGGQYTATLSKSDLALQGKVLSATEGRSAAISKVKQAYITMLAAQQDLDVKRQVLDKQSKLLQQVQAVYALKQASAVDLQTAQVNAKSAQIDVATADKTLRLANERLAIIMGRPAGLRFFVADVSNPSLPASSVEDAITIGLEKRTDLAQYLLSAKSTRIDAALAKAQAQPGVSLTGGAGLAMNWVTPPATEMAVSLGAKITAPIIDSGAADLQAKTSEAQAALYDLQARQLSDSLAADIRDYYESAQLAAQKIDLAKESADLAEAQLELEKAQNKYGTATMQDVLTASVTAATAEENYATARSAYLSAVLNLETAMGL
jgi:outer membrane protein TolC